MIWAVMVNDPIYLPCAMTFVLFYLIWFCIFDLASISIGVLFVLANFILGNFSNSDMAFATAFAASIPVLFYYLIRNSVFGLGNLKGTVFGYSSTVEFALWKGGKRKARG
jgi:hypothetical protein